MKNRSKSKRPTDRTLAILERKWPASEPISPRIRQILGSLIDEAISIGWQDAADALKEHCSDFDRDDHAFAAADWLEAHRPL